MNGRDEVMKKRIFTFILTLVLTISLYPFHTYAAETTDKTIVEVYLSISHDAGYFKTPKGHVMAFKKMSVPYFDLANYDLQKYYFVSERYEKGDDTVENEDGKVEKPSSNLTPGNAEFAAGKVTMLHALIYATEVYYLGVNPENAGQGELARQGKIGTNVFKPEGSVGSMYLRHFWDMDENLNYYHNYKYPLASEGWGSTADQILLHDGDIITLGHFTNWSFHQDPKSVFNFIKAGDETVIAEVEQNKSIDLTVYLAGKGGNYTTAHTPRTEGMAVYYAPLSGLSNGTVSGWNYVGHADENGNIKVDAWMEPGEYLVAVAGQYGGSKELQNVIVSAPGGIILKVTDPVLLGDVNSDGSVNVLDALRLKQFLAGQPNKTIEQANADVTADGNVNLLDALRLVKYLAGVEGVVLG